MEKGLDVLMKNVNGKFRIRCYGPTSFREEFDKDGKPRYHIYVEDEEVEIMPYGTSEEEAEKRFNEILELIGIECGDMFVRRPI